MHTGLVASRYRKCEECGRDAAFDITRNVCTVVGCYPGKRMAEAMLAAMPAEEDNTPVKTAELIEAEQRVIVEAVKLVRRETFFLMNLDSAVHHYERTLKRAQEST